ncbi:hypothetical protein PMAYCL1PPCAC_28775, partial [Pristionchus mayeri]
LRNGRDGLVLGSLSDCLDQTQAIHSIRAGVMGSLRGRRSGKSILLSWNLIRMSEIGLVVGSARYTLVATDRILR